ncbi:MAG: hypothetical protein QOD47_327 [Gemmatimonadaceae bacterium]|jgi:steroid delta-isomerase-like uncharacterized protein|nr:hypothetical protein [Gemmatimonadaceae bacterium]
MRRLSYLAASVFAIVAAGCAVEQKPPAASGKAVAEAYVHAWNKHDFAALDTILAPNATHDDIAQNVHAKGPAAIKDFMRRDIANEPDLNWQMTNTVEDGRFVAFEWTWTSTYTGPDVAGKTVTNKKLSGGGASFVEIENGKIKRFADYYDLGSFFR